MPSHFHWKTVAVILSLFFTLRPDTIESIFCEVKTIIPRKVHENLSGSMDLHENFQILGFVALKHQKGSYREAPTRRAAPSPSQPGQRLWDSGLFRPFRARSDEGSLRRVLWQQVFVVVVFKGDPWKSAVRVRANQTSNLLYIDTSYYIFNHLYFMAPW